MSKILAVFAAAALVAAAALGAAPETVRGEVVDVACQKTKGAAGVGIGHIGCIMTCARKGDQLGIMTTDAVYEIVGEYSADKNAKLIEFLAQEVEATGEVTTADGKKTMRVTSMKVAQ